jgi:hypothetical protein
MRLLEEGLVPLPLDTREHTGSCRRAETLVGSYRHNWVSILTPPVVHIDEKP